MRPLQPLTLSPIMTFGFVATLALSAGAWWKDRLRLHHEIERLHWQMSYPVHPKPKLPELHEEEQLVSDHRSAQFPNS